jgi:dihydrolipoamide dehydrogenase
MADSSTDNWDVIVIGGGPPGENAADYAIKGSDRTAAIVEQELVGGECSYWACMPSKALLRPVELLSAAQAMPGLHVEPDLDVAAVLKRRDEFVHNHDDSSQVKWANDNHIDVIRGRGRLAGERTVEVTGADGEVRTLHARHAVVLATGTTAAIPPVSGMREARPWTSRDVTNLHEIPRRVAIVGGGVVACEAAVWLHGLGVESLIIIEMVPTLLARNEPFAGELLQQAFEQRGIQVHLGVSVERVQRPDVRDTGVGHLRGGEVTLTFAGQTISVDELVVATGRTPSSSDLGLETVGLPGEGFLDTDEHMSVRDLDGDWLYAIGDLSGKALLTHMGKYQGRICGAVIAARADGRPLEGDDYRDLADQGAIPQVTFTDPQVASVGRTEKEARDEGFDVQAVEYDLAAIAGALLLRDGYTGRAKLVINRGTGALVGATFVGPEVAELVHAATVAIVGRVPVSTLWHAVPSYPTVSEIWLRLLETLRTKA